MGSAPPCNPAHIATTAYAANYTELLNPAEVVHPCYSLVPGRPLKHVLSELSLGVDNAETVWHCTNHTPTLESFALYTSGDKARQSPAREKTTLWRDFNLNFFSKSQKEIFNQNTKMRGEKPVPEGCHVGDRA